MFFNFYGEAGRVGAIVNSFIHDFMLKVYFNSPDLYELSADRRTVKKRLTLMAT